MIPYYQNTHTEHITEDREKKRLEVKLKNKLTFINLCSLLGLDDTWVYFGMTCQKENTDRKKRKKNWNLAAKTSAGCDDGKNLEMAQITRIKNNNKKSKTAGLPGEKEIAKC